MKPKFKVWQRVKCFGNVYTTIKTIKDNGLYVEYFLDGYMTQQERFIEAPNGKELSTYFNI